MRKTVYQTNFERLITLGIVKEGHLRPNGRSRSGGFMDLVFEKLPYLDGFNGQRSRLHFPSRIISSRTAICARIRKW